MDKITPYLKALVAFVVAFAGNLLFAMQPETAGGAAITGNEWLRTLVLTVASTGAVYLTPNKDPKGRHQRESVQPPHA